MTKLAEKKSNLKTNSQKLTAVWFFGNVFLLIRQFGAHIVWAMVVVYCVRVCTEALSAFAGRTSIANLVLDIAAHVNATIAFSITVSLATSALWANEYRRHRKTRERLTARCTKLEQQIDPQRTSSELTSEGLTRRGDL